MPDDIAQLNEDIARGLKADGLSANEVRGKLISVHGVPMAESLILVERVFGPGAVPSRTASVRNAGLVLVASGLGGGALTYFAIGFTPMRLALVLYVAAFGAFSSGLIALGRSLEKT